MEKFLKIVETIRSIPGRFGFLTAVPLLDFIADFGPPAPSTGSVALIAAAFGAVAIFLAYLFRPQMKKKRLRRWAIRAFIGFFLLTVTFLILDFSLVFRSPPPSNERRVKGFIYISQEVRELANEDGNDEGVLRGGEWKPSSVYAPCSIVTAQCFLLFTYVAAFALLCFSVALFVLWLPASRLWSKSANRTS
jgi:hypothetical protein